MLLMIVLLIGRIGGLSLSRLYPCLVGRAPLWPLALLPGVKAAFPLARRTDALEQDVMPGEFKPAPIPDGLFQALQVRQIHVHDLAASRTSGVVVAVALVVIPVWAIRHLQFEDFSALRQLVEVAVDRRPADGWVLLGDGGMNLVRRRVAP